MFSMLRRGTRGRISLEGSSSSFPFKDACILVACILLLLLSSPRIYSQSTKLERHSLDQIRSLQEEKRLRTPAQRKLDSQLVYALKRGRGVATLAAAPLLRPSLDVERDGRVLVDLRAEVTLSLLRFIEANGGTLVERFHKSKAYGGAESLRFRIALSAAAA